MHFLLYLSCFYFAFVGLIDLSFAQDTNLATVRQAFETAKIPTDVHFKFSPKFLLEVTLPQPSGDPVQVTAGATVLVNATAIAPEFSIITRRSRLFGGPYVVAAIDPDAPTPQNPNASQVRHFLGGNFFSRPSGRNTAKLVNFTAALSEWLQPGPPAGSPPHRYTFFLFKQPLDFNRQMYINASTSILNFNLSQFAAEVGLGSPIGGTFMEIGPAQS